VSGPTAVVLRAIGLGDMLTGLPAMALLRRAVPGHRIVGAVPGRYADLLVQAGLLDAVLPTPSLEPLAGAPTEPEIAVDLHGNGAPSRDLLQALRPGRLIAFARPGDDVPPGAEVSVWDDDEHEVARWCRLLREHLAGVGEAPPVWTLLPAPPPVHPGATVVHPGAASGSRRWPAERWAAVARALSADGHRVVVTGTPGEQALVEAVAAAAEAEAATDLDVDGLFGLIAAARLLLSGDTGVAHVASAFGTPSVVLFGPVSPARWGPPPRARHQALWPAPDPGYRGDPHGNDPDPVLLQIPVDDVLAAAERAVAGADVRKISPAGSQVVAPGGS
jgi:ADP-heptose:LPS heptosyltransferase